MRKVIALLLIAVGVIFIVNNLKGSALLGKEEEAMNEHRTFAAEDIQAIAIDGRSINIKLEEGSTQDEVVVRLTGGDRNKDKLITELEGNVLQIEHKREWSLLSFNFNDKTELTVELPTKQWEKLEAKVSSGNIYAEKLLAEHANLKSSSGNIRINELEAERADLSTSSGNIQVEQFTTELLTTNVSSGNTRLRQGKGGVEVSSSSGNIDVNMDTIERSIKLKAGSGNIELTAAEEPADAKLDIRTSSGRLSVQWNGFTSKSMNEESFEGVVGSGAIKIDVTTGSGNIKLSK